MKKKITHYIGVDEAGRGPLAGPVSVGIVCIPSHFDWEMLHGVNDSKLLSEKKREEIFQTTNRLKREQVLDYWVSMVSAHVIDKIGITYAVRLGIERSFRKLNVHPETVAVKLDGLLKAPNSFLHQETIIKGDQSERVIGLASIMAKVTRDRYMIRKSNEYPEYDFKIHKGYGTKKHREKISTIGLCPLHRKTYIKYS